MMMRIRHLSLFLIALLLVNMIDEYLAPAPTFLAYQIAEEDDIYLSSLHETIAHQSISRKHNPSIRHGFATHEAGQYHGRFHATLTARNGNFAPLPLSQFTSMQI